MIQPLRPAGRFQGEEVVVARYAESIAEVFPDWINRCRLDGNMYNPFDLNMPVRVPQRENMKSAYQSDPPISEVGRIMAQIFARELVTRNAVPKAIYTSPALACVQTAADIRNFIGAECGNIHIEPGFAGDKSGQSNWMSPKQFVQLKYNVDENYTPENERSSKNAFPAMSSIVLMRKDNNVEPSRLYMRPLTMIGRSTRRDIEISTDANARS
ncbi:unnamed protein product [Nippostrongylus brasiliensis]|uniref:Protein UBASH3A homolog (inferred by orthology to a D. melanogaster protein) n=1 Tax=Nippostrongylus brasiliensis TaxID=27835 RepID=A0A0N4Y9R4_NIPBR|nr:unnamed protein product [Nippostrongylus brasiliensis]